MKVLIADDETSLREILATYLEAHGHFVTAAKNGLEAFQFYHRARRLGADFDFVLSDYQMPEKNGVVLLMEIREANPVQRMALYSADPPRMPKELTDVTVLEKPVRLARILEVVNG